MTVTLGHTCGEESGLILVRNKGPVPSECPVLSLYTILGWSIFTLGTELLLNGTVIFKLHG